MLCKGLNPWNKGKPASEDVRERLSKTQFQKGQSTWNKGKKTSEEVRKKLSEAHKGLPSPKKGKPGKKQTKEWREKISASLQGITRSEETRKKMSAAKKGKHCVGHKHTEESKRKISKSRLGEKHWNWRGGVSFEPYCPKFDLALKEAVRDRFGRICFLCGRDEFENGRALPVHHTDYNKMQGCGDRPWRLLPLCHSHNSKANFNRWYWFALLYNHWVMNPEINFASYEVIVLEKI